MQLGGKTSNGRNFIKWMAFGQIATDHQNMRCVLKTKVPQQNKQRRIGGGVKSYNGFPPEPTAPPPVVPHGKKIVEGGLTLVGKY